MQTLIDISEDDLQKIDELSKAERITREELLRKIISLYVHPLRDARDAAFGLWSSHAEDGVEYQQRIRQEW